MIELGTVDGSEAVLSYVNDKIESVDKSMATMIVASLADGRKLFLRMPQRPGGRKVKDDEIGS